MKYPLELISLEIKLALKVSSILQKPLTQVLIDYTDFYKQFRYGSDYNPNNPKWVSYINNFTTDPYYTYYHSINERAASDKARGKNPQEFGCFSYEYTKATKTIHLHFANNTHEPQGPLSISVIDVRKEELRQLFNHAKVIYPQAQTVSCESWLCNVNSFKRLFPNQFFVNMQFNGWNIQNRAYWGQFLNSEGGIKDTLVRGFKEQIDSLETVFGIVESVPLRPVVVKGVVKDFYSFY